MFGSGRYVPNGCVASVAFVPFTSFRSERNDVNASNVSHRLCWLVCVRCKPFIQQPHHPVSVKDCQKKLNATNTGIQDRVVLLEVGQGLDVLKPHTNTEEKQKGFKHPDFPAGHPRQYYPGLLVLNFSNQAG